MIGIFQKIKKFFRRLFGKGNKQKKTQREHKEFKNEEFLPIVVELLKHKKTVTIPLKGISMRPFLENNRDAALLTLPGEVKVWDPVLAEIEPDDPNFQKGQELLAFCRNFKAIYDTKDIPSNSLIREFIGGSCFNVR